jgi:hypothetical protein
MIKEILLISFVLLLIQSTDASAYLDPGTGSFIFQILLAALAAGFFVIKQYWQKIKSFFSRNGQKHEDDG